MHAFPHFYRASASVTVGGDADVTSDGLPSIRSAPPAAFGGPGDRWSPETLLTAAVADCFVLQFRAIAAASKLTWLSLTCDVVGTLERIDRVTQFTSFVVRAQLQVPEGVGLEQAHRLLAKAEETCLVTRSLKAATHLQPSVEIASLQPA